jgi:hypothetical protein
MPYSEATKKILTQKKFRIQVSGSYLDWKYLKQRDHKTSQGPHMRMPDIKENIQTCK